MVREGTRAGSLPNCGHFIRELEVSRRTLMRDLDFLRDDHHAPIACDDSRKGLGPQLSTLNPQPPLQSRFWLKSTGVCASLAPRTYGVVPYMKRRVKTRHQCRRCPFRAPSGRCLNPSLKSGRCGDWIWYFRGGRQVRRRYTRPKDPATLAQLRCRALFKAASRSYSRALTQAEREACIAEGVQVRSRVRLGQSGPLTGQQYWVKGELARAESKVKPELTIFAPKVSQPQRVTRSTSEMHRILTGHSPESHRLRAVQARKGRVGSGRVERRMNKAGLPSQVPQNQRVTGCAGRRHRRTVGARRWRVARPARKAVAPPGHLWSTPRRVSGRGAGGIPPALPARRPSP
jgi:hypothetical protein